MTRARLRRIGIRLASAAVRRARGGAARLFAPDEREALHASWIAAPSLAGRTIAVTGSTRGVGLALATAFARAGARVVINGRDLDRLHAATTEIARAGGEVTGVGADVSTAEGARRLISSAVGVYGGIDALVNNAALLGPHGTPAWIVEPDDFDRVIATNLRGAFLCAREAMRWMAEHSVAGRIVQVSSGAGRRAAAGLAPYVASKHALEGLTRALALDADGSGIAVCAVELGTVQTDMSRELLRWEDHARLPPPESVVPVFLHALTAPAADVHDRVLCAWRHERDPAAEARLAQPLAAFRKASFEPLVHGGRTRPRGDPELRFCDRAEHPLGMPGRVRELLTGRAGELDFSRYPDEHYPRLRAALAERLALEPDRFTFGAGSAELVERAVRCFAGRGDPVVCNDPTWFPFDRFCGLVEADVRKVPAVQPRREGAFDHNLEQLAKAVGPRTRLVYLVNPSNPLGNGIRRSDFLAFLDAIPPGVPVVVDEAYVEFSEDPDLLRVHEVVRQSDRLLIGLRTFSKFYGLAALRIGYAFGSAEAIDLLERLEPLFALSSLAEEAALAALGDEAHARATRDWLRVEKAWLRARLAELGLASPPSETHFLLVESPLPAAEADRVTAAFADRGIVPPRGIIAQRYWMLPVLDREQNDRNLQVLASL